MRFDVITLFAELFGPHLTHGITRRAFASGQMDVKLWSPRDFADNAYRRVDDRPYGGGPGMVMMAEPLARTLEAISAARTQADVPVIHFTPTGAALTQSVVQAMLGGPGAVLLCGRYEGIDQRLLDRHVTLEISLGDFVLSGGELAALALLDALARLQPGVLGDAQSHQQDSFSHGLLDCPHFSRPEVWAGPGGADDAVPPVLMSGHHGAIARWRRERALELTARRRPDLLHQARAAQRLTPEDELFLRALGL
jgi:tRNA (guanine37-N1)-methyltransferase